MSNSVTKLPNADALAGQANQNTANRSNQTASARVSAGQGREIFSQVNVSLGANPRNSDITRSREKSKPDNNNSNGEKTDWKSIKQGTDSAKTSKARGTNSPNTATNRETDSSNRSENPRDNGRRPDNPGNRGHGEQTRNHTAGKANNGHQKAKSDDDNNNSRSRNDNQTARQNNENRRAESNNQPRVETANSERNNGNRNVESRRGNSTDSNNGTNRPDNELNRRGNGNQSHSNRRQGAANASTNGLDHGRGHNKSGQNNQNPANTSPGNQNSASTSPNNQNPVNAPKDAVENNSLFNNRNQPTNNRNQPTINDTPGRNATHANATQTRHLNVTVNFSISNNPENHSSSPGNRQNGFLGEVIRQVFRENDVYLSRNAVDTLVEQRGANVLNRSGNRAFHHLPKEIFQLVELIENQLLQNSNLQQIDNKYDSNRMSIEILPELENQIQAAKNLFTQIFGTSDVKHFSRMNIQERMLAAIEIFLKNLPAEMPGNLQNNSIEKVLAGFLLARGLVISDARNSPENLLGMMQSAATDKVSLAAMRDFGGLVKVLISDAAASKSTANLETAVQKFARVLVAINCLDTILTAVKLASQSQFAGGSVGRTLAIAQVYELINRLVLAGQNAMKEAAAEVAQKNAAFNAEADKNSRSVFPAKTVADLTETDGANNKTGESKNVQAESVLRKFLEFNPLMANDKFVSAFENSDDARQAQKDFLDHHQIEIEQWLRGGNHRLVKDIDFEKPIGIVVERNANDFLSATTARIVLVRDGSVQGWHFLKSFLVA